MKDTIDGSQIITATTREPIFFAEQGDEHIISPGLKAQIDQIFDGSSTDAQYEDGLELAAANVPTMVEARALGTISTLFAKPKSRVIADSALEAWHPEFFGPAGPKSGPWLPKKPRVLSEVDPGNFTGGRRAPSRRVRQMTESEVSDFQRRERLVRRLHTPAFGAERLQAVAAGGLLAVTLALGVANKQGFTEPAEIMKTISQQIFD